MTDSLAQIGVTGLAVMGSNIARNFAHHGYTVAVHNRSDAKTDALIAEHGNEGNFIPTKSIAEFAAALEKPRKALIMVQAGPATDAVIEELASVFEPGDIIIDGGNSLYTDTIRREADLAQRGIHFVGTGISGGEEGALNGPSIMPGGSDESYRSIGPILESISAHVDNVPCCAHIGPNGSGHFVKMVHNGIEYADMELIAEAYQLLRDVAGLTPQEQVPIFKEWNNGKLGSYLIEITAEVLAQIDKETGLPLVDVISDHAGQKGTGRWTGKAALDFGVPATGIVKAVFARALSSSVAIREVGQTLPAGDTHGISDDHKKRFIDDVQKALYASKIIAYAQGFDLINAGSEEYKWNIKPGELATIWRGGCIIRAQFLDRIRAAYEQHPELPSLLASQYFADEVAEAIDAWRRVVIAAITAGVAVPAFSSLLAYYDAIRSPRLPTALIQGQRDFFGAHTYQRIDKPGTYHTLWSGDRSEIRTS